MVDSGRVREGSEKRASGLMKESQDDPLSQSAIKAQGSGLSHVSDTDLHIPSSAMPQMLIRFIL